MHQQLRYKPKVLFVDDDDCSRDLLRAYFRPRGFDVHFAEGPLQALAQFEGPLRDIDVMVTDLILPDFDGMELIRRVRKIDQTVPLILMTGHSSLETAVEALNEGASDFFVKPLHLQQLELCIMRVFRMHELHRENKTLRQVIKEKDESVAEGVVGRSEGLRQACELAKRVAGSNANVLITGETGTGKEVLARAIHKWGDRKNGPFVAINCSAIPETLLEGELFGYNKGAFTGATERKPGLFEEANGGTLFLDEIGDLPLPLQTKLLRVLQERKIKRLGENQFRDIDVRIVAATHKNLPRAVGDGSFREDLFFRLNVIPITLPALRDRREDVVPLAESFLRKFAAVHGVPVRGFSPDVLEHFLSYPWPGNIRELENTVERAVLLCDGATVQKQHLLMQGRLGLDGAGESAGLGATAASGGAELAGSSGGETSVLTLDEITRRHILRVLEHNRGAKDKTARMLGIDRKTLYRKLHEYSATGAERPPGLGAERAPGPMAAPQ